MTANSTLSRWCPKCKKPFGDLQGVIKRWRSAFGEGYMLHKCPECGAPVIYSGGVCSTPEPDDWLLEGTEFEKSDH